MENISFQVHLAADYDTARQQVIEALKAEGFGVLTEIDVRATFKNKLDADFRPYAILGACNPSLSHKVLQSEPLVGMLLPCNVTVEASEGGSLVNLVNPRVMLLTHPLLADNPAVMEVASDAYDRLQRVAAALKAA